MARAAASADGDPAACGVGLALGGGVGGCAISVASVTPGLAAARLNGACPHGAAIVPGDRLLAINARPTAHMDTGEAEQLLLGVAGSEVEVRLARAGDGGGEERAVRLMRGTASFWHFYEEVQLLHNEIQRRKGAYELLKQRHAECQAALTQSEAALHESARRVAVLTEERDEARRQQDRLGRERDEARQQHREEQQKTQTLGEELERWAGHGQPGDGAQAIAHAPARPHSLAATQPSGVTAAEDAHRAHDHSEALVCVSVDSLESQAQELQALVFRALRHTRELLKEREFQREQHGQLERRVSEAKELRRKTERQRRQQMCEIKQQQGVVAFAARTLFDQLSLMGAEIGIVVEALISATRQERKYVENAFERQRSMGQELTDLTARCQALTRQLEHAAASAQQTSEQCDDLEGTVHELTLLVTLLKDSAENVALEKASSHKQQEIKEVQRQQKVDSLESRVRDLQELVEEREKVRDLISEESVQRAACIERLQQSLGEANRACEDKSRQVEFVKKEASAELMRLLRMLSAMHKQHLEFAGTPQCCGVGVVLEPRGSSPGTGCLSLGHSPPPIRSSELDSSSDLPCEQFVVRDLMEGFSGATCCALQKGDRVLSIDGVDVSGKTESTAGTFDLYRESIAMLYAIVSFSSSLSIPMGSS